MSLKKSLHLLAKKMLEQDFNLALAESCTGGLLACVITDLSGASQWFDRAYITYSNQAKMDMLHVQAATLKEYGAVSEVIALEMAIGALKAAKVSHALSITGIAGPTGGSDKKPVGMVCFGLATNTGKNQSEKSETCYFIGSRQGIRDQAAIYGIQLLIESVK